MANMTTLQILQGIHDWVLNEIDEQTADFITNTVDNLVNYYKKSETYTKSEVQQIVDTIKQFTYEVVQVLPTASESTMNKIYLVPAPKSEDKNIKEEYITIRSGSAGSYTYSWELLGTTSIDLSNYYTKGETDSAISAALTSALQDYTTTDDLMALLDTKANIDGFYETMGVGTAMNLVGKTENTNNSMYRKTGGAEEATDGTATLKNIKGNTVAWNQLQRTFYSLSKRESGVTFNISEDKTQIVAVVGDGGATEDSWAYTPGIELTVGHKYISRGCPKGGSNNTYFAANAYSGFGGDYGSGVLFQVEESNLRFCFDAVIKANTPAGTYIFTPQLFDLTLIYGAGNEPATVAQFEADYEKWFGKPLSYEEYDAGSLRSVQLDAIKTTGFNQWDEEWELGILNYNPESPSFGEELASSTQIRAKNFIKVLPNTEYYLRIGSGNAFALLYDKNKKGIAAWAYKQFNGKITTTGDTEYLRFYFTEGYGTTYKGDTCINISDTAKNGTYEPYEEHIASVPTTTLTGKLNGEGESVVVFPDGMKSAGNVHDEIYSAGGKTYAVKRVGSVDLGSLDWRKENVFKDITFSTNPFISDISTSPTDQVPNLTTAKYPSCKWNDFINIDRPRVGMWGGSTNLIISDSSYTDAATFKAAMNGVMLHYELETPLVYEVEDFILPKPYVVNGDGTEEQVQKQGVQGVASTLTCSYGMDAVKTLMNLPQRFVSAAEEQNFSESQKVLARRNIGVEEILAHKANQEGVYEGLTVGLADNLRGDNVVGAEFYRRKSGGTQSVTSGIAAIKEVKGKSLVWNQLLAIPSFTSDTEFVNGMKFINNGDGSVTVVVDTGGATAQGWKSLDSLNCESSHKYLVGRMNTDKAFLYMSDSGIVTNMSGRKNIYIVVSNGAPAGTYKVYVNIIDLTLMFGAGNEPATVAEFEKMFPLPYYDYNAGEVIPFAGENLVTTGFNQWDEEWELGSISTNNGQNEASQSTFRSKNLIPVFQGGTYYYNSNSIQNIYGRMYDSQKNFIGYAAIGLIQKNTTFTIPTGCSYIRFVADGTTYNHDICINISDPNKNGTYEPYEKHTLPLDPSQWRDKNGDLVFPYGGMHGTSTAYDYAKVDADGYIRKAVRCFGGVDLGTLDYMKPPYLPDGAYSMFTSTPTDGIKAKSYDGYLSGKCICSKYISSSFASYGNMADKTIAVLRWTNSIGSINIKDSSYSNGTASGIASLKASLDGVMLYYELAEPVEVELATPVYANYYVNGGGTEAIEPDNGAAPYTSPANLSIIYAMDARGEINNLPKNYLSKESAENMLGAMQTAGIIAGYTMTFDSATNRYVFTITAPTAPSE